MFKVKCLKDFGQWARAGKTYNLSNSLANSLRRNEEFKVLNYTGDGRYPRDREGFELQIKKNAMRIYQLEKINEKYKAMLKVFLKEEK